MKFAELWSILPTEEKDALARQIGTERGYLQQIAVRWRGRRPSLDFMRKMVVADARLSFGDLAEEFSEATAPPTPEPAGQGA